MVIPGIQLFEAGRVKAPRAHRGFAIAAGFATAILILTFIAVLSYRSIGDFEEDSQLVEDAHEVLLMFAALKGALRQATVHERGYLLWGNTAFLRARNMSIEQVERNLAQLRKAATSPRVTARMSSLTEAVNARIALFDEMIALRDKEGLEAVAQFLDSGGPGRAVAAIEKILDQIEHDERQLLKERSQESDASGEFAKRTIVFGNLAGFAILALAFGLLRREVAQRERVQFDAQRYAKEVESLYNNAPCGYHSVDEHAVIVRMNDTALSWLGYDRDEVVGKLRHPDLMTPESAKLFDEQIFPLFKSQGWLQDVEFNYVRKDGSIMPAALNATLVRDAHGNYLMSRSTLNDITARKQAEAKLSKANTFLDSVIENIPNMIFVKDAKELKFVRVNKAGEKLLGCTRSQLLGKNNHDFFPQEEADFLTATDRQVIMTGRQLEIAEEKILTTDKGERILRTRKLAIPAADGSPEYLLGISDDITERKRAEEQISELNASLKHRASELEATNQELESFSYSVSHDLRSPLRAVDGYSMMLEEDFGEKLDGEGRRLLSVIRENSQKMGKLIDDLLAFSRLGRKPIAKSTVDMQGLVTEVVAELEAGSADVPLPELSVMELPLAWGDRALLRQVWINLLSNAVKFSRKSSKPRVEVGVTRESTQDIYWVHDNGAGFDMQYYNKLFGVFQRLHSNEQFAGTGVGLAIVQRVVMRHQGKVWAEGKLGEGATFYFVLPHAETNGQNAAS